MTAISKYKTISTNIPLIPSIVLGFTNVYRQIMNLHEMILIFKILTYFHHDLFTFIYK